jgi:hypothetical protein
MEKFGQGLARGTTELTKGLIGMLSFYTLLESGVYEPLSKDRTTNIERKVQELLSEHKIPLPIDLKHKLTPYHSKSPSLYGFPKIHKSGIFSNLLSLHPSLVQIFSSTPCSYFNVRDQVSHPYNLISCASGLFNDIVPTINSISAQVKIGKGLEGIGRGLFQGTTPKIA